MGARSFSSVSWQKLCGHVKMVKKRISWRHCSFIPCLQITPTAAKGHPLPMFENTSCKCLSCLYVFTAIHVKSQNTFIQKNLQWSCNFLLLIFHFIICVLFEIVRRLFPILFLPLLFASSQLFTPPKFILN